MKHRIRVQHESDMWAAYLRLCAELNKLGKTVSRVKFDIAAGGCRLYAYATVWSD